MAAPDQDGSDNAFLAGTNCSLETCGRVDFLPIVCPRCAAAFCSSHASPPDKHACVASTSRDRGEGSSAEPRAKRWKAEEESFKALIPNREKAWQAQKDEEIRVDVEKEAKKLAALEVLRRNFPEKDRASSTTSAGAKPLATKKPLSPAIRLMQLKRRAKPGDPRKKEGDVPMESRWYGTVRWAESVDASADDEGIPIWFDKGIVAGKALDFLTETLRIPPPTAGQSLLLQLSVPPSGRILKLSQALGQQVEVGDDLHIVREAPVSSVAEPLPT